MLWRCYCHNASQLLQALVRRIERKPERKSRKKNQSIALEPIAVFNQHRLAQSQRARTLAMILIPVSADYSIPLRRAPDIRLACNEAYGASSGDFVVSLREILGLIGAHEWRKNGVMIEAQIGRGSCRERGCQYV